MSRGSPGPVPLGYVIGVVLVWAVVFAIGYVRTGSTVGHPILHVCLGFLLGMLSMYMATQVYPSGRNAHYP